MIVDGRIKFRYIRRRRTESFEEIIRITMITRWRSITSYTKQPAIVFLFFLFPLSLSSTNVFPQTEKTTGTSQWYVYLHKDTCNHCIIRGMAYLKGPWWGEIFLLTSTVSVRAWMCYALMRCAYALFWTRCLFELNGIYKNGKCYLKAIPRQFR